VWGTVTRRDLLLLRGGVSEAMEPDRLPEFLICCDPPECLKHCARQYGEAKTID